MKPLALIAILLLSICYADNTKAASAYYREMEVRYINTSYDALHTKQELLSRRDFSKKH